MTSTTMTTKTVKTRRPFFTALCAGLTLTLSLAHNALAIDAARKEQGEKMAQKAIEFLRTRQDPATGGWSVPQGPEAKGKPQLPAISSLVLNGMLMQPGISAATDNTVSKGVKYVLSFRQPDGGIYDGILPSYNTAISLSMLARVDTPEAKAAIAPAQQFLRDTQWGAPINPGATVPGGKEAPKPVTKDDPGFGGWGYGNRGRPDMSNTAFALQGLHDSGVASDDPAFQRALIFLQRLQMDGKVNDQAYAKGSKQGGFVYAPGETAQTMGQGNSWAGMIEESLDDGTRVSRLRCYGSVTYSGFKSYIYAGLTKDDPRVQNAKKWLMNHYNPVENPGMGTNGYYYYVLVMSRSLDALGSAELKVEGLEPLRVGVLVSKLPRGVTEAQIRALVKDAGTVRAVVMYTDTGGGRSAVVSMSKDEEAEKAETILKSAKLSDTPLIVSRLAPGVDAPSVRDWQNDLIDALSALQNEDGSFKAIDERWMENNPDLATAYALLAIQHAIRK